MTQTPLTRRPLVTAALPHAPRHPIPAPPRRPLKVILTVLLVALIVAGLIAVLHTAETPPTHETQESGFVLTNLRARIYQNGRLEGDVHAGRAVLNIDTHEASLQKMAVTFYGSDGKPTGNVYSERGKMYLEDRPEAGISKNDLEMSEGVRFEAPKGMTISMPRLRYQSAQQIIRSAGGWFEKRIPLSQGAVLVCRGDYFTTTRDLTEISDYGAELRQEKTDSNLPSPQ